MEKTNRVPLSYCVHFALALFLFMMLWFKADEASLRDSSASSEHAQLNNDGSASSVSEDWIADSSY